MNSIGARPFAWSGLLILSTIAAGIAVRFAHVGLPPAIVKYGGSMLWAATIYWVVSTVLSRLGISLAALTAAVVATSIEFFKLYRSPGMDAFRETLPGVLLLGRYFSLWDIVAYWVAITLAAAADYTMRRRR